MKRLALCAVLLAVSGCAPSETAPQSAPPPLEAPDPVDAPELLDETVVLDPAAKARLLAADGVTLQWIDWSHRGQVFVREENGTIRLTGSQVAADGPGRLFLDGTVREIGADYFVFDGTIRIDETPDAGRHCEADKLWHFAVTQNRPYWRLREFEWCDYLTDYVDVYFPGTKP
jgi:hypothetical protein